MNDNIRNSKIMLLDKSIIFISGFFVATISLFLSVNNLIINLLFVLLFIVIYIFYLLILIFEYRNTKLEINEEYVNLSRVSVFGIKKIQLYYDNIASINDIRKFYFKRFNVVLIKINSDTSVKRDSDDIVFYLNESDYELIEKYYSEAREDDFQVIEKVNDVKELQVNKSDHDLIVDDVRIYKKSEIFKYVIIRSINFIITFIISVIVLFFDVFIFKTLRGELFIIITFIIIFITMIFNIITLYFTYSNFTVKHYENKIGIRHGLINNVSKVTEFNKVKVVIIKSLKLLKLSSIELSVIGLNTEDKRPNIVSLYDKNENNNQILKLLNYNFADISQIQVNENYILTRGLIYNVIFLLISFLVAIVSLFYAILFLIITELFIVLVTVYVYVYTKNSVTYSFNNEFIIKEEGLIVSTKKIIKKDDVQNLEIRESLIMGMFNVVDLHFVNYKTEFNNVIVMKYINKSDINNILLEIKPKY